MNFKEVTDGLFDRISHEELAGALGISVASIRQGRLPVTAKAHRTAPPGWENAALRLAEKQRDHFDQLAATIRRIETNQSSKKLPKV